MRRQVSNDASGSAGQELCTVGAVTASSKRPSSNPATAVAALENVAIGRRREVEIVLAALSSGRNVVLEGPPGTGKSTLLRAVAAQLDTGLVFVEGNAELTPARLLGAHDPALVLERGYSDDTFVDGPLLGAMRGGSLLYLEELNRIPEETLNILITAMAEREVHVPRVGTIHADTSFRLVAAMNPFDSVGTARVSGAFADRANRVAMGYQSAADEARIVARALGTDHPSLGIVSQAVAVTRSSRTDREIRIGASVRGAIDLAHIAADLAVLRSTAVDDRTVTLDASLAALTGRIRLHDGLSGDPEPVVERLWRQAFVGAAEPAPPAAGKARAPQQQGPAPAAT
jgi:MoxR-like ATPase